MSILDLQARKENIPQKLREEIENLLQQPTDQTQSALMQIYCPKIEQSDLPKQRFALIFKTQRTVQQFIEEFSQSKEKRGRLDIIEYQVFDNVLFVFTKRFFKLQIFVRTIKDCRLNQPLAVLVFAKRLKQLVELAKNEFSLQYKVEWDWSFQPRKYTKRAQQLKMECSPSSQEKINNFGDCIKPRIDSSSSDSEKNNLPSELFLPQRKYRYLNSEYIKLEESSLVDKIIEDLGKQNYSQEWLDNQINKLQQIENTVKNEIQQIKQERIFIEEFKDYLIQLFQENTDESEEDDEDEYEEEEEEDQEEESESSVKQENQSKSFKEENKQIKNKQQKTRRVNEKDLPYNYIKVGFTFKPQQYLLG